MSAFDNIEIEFKGEVKYLPGTYKTMTMQKVVFSDWIVPLLPKKSELSADFFLPFQESVGKNGMECKVKVADVVLPADVKVGTPVVVRARMKSWSFNEKNGVSFYLMSVTAQH